MSLHNPRWSARTAGLSRGKIGNIFGAEGGGAELPRGGSRSRKRDGGRWTESPEENLTKRSARRSRSERLAVPKVFGATSCAGHAIHQSRGSTVLGGGGTSDLDTNRGPPIPTPNAKNSTRVYAGTFTLSKFFAVRVDRWTLVPSYWAFPEISIGPARGKASKKIYTRPGRDRVPERGSASDEDLRFIVQNSSLGNFHSHCRWVSQGCTGRRKG
ncbi:hypothetical protein KM043_015320 [Ampulex compressa]|nr:hypothetical protein KM043_015320 [Ampulex compressa]